MRKESGELIKLWRKRAEECRKLMKLMSSESVKAQFERMARVYDSLAESNDAEADKWLNHIWGPLEQ